MSHSDGAAAVLRIEPRWTDLDPVGHVNNNVFLVYAEEARARYLHAALPDSWEQIVVVHNAIDYHRPVEITDVVEVRSSITDVGNSSLTTLNEIANTHGTRCATVRTVQVVLGDDRMATRPWSDRERAALQNLVIEDQ